MQNANNIFELTYNLALIKVEQLSNELYRVNFSNEVPTINILRTQNADGSTTWESIPPGNTEMADAIGKLIDNHLK